MQPYSIACCTLPVSVTFRAVCVRFLRKPSPAIICKFTSLYLANLQLYKLGEYPSFFLVNLLVFISQICNFINSENLRVVFSQIYDFDLENCDFFSRKSVIL